MLLDKYLHPSDSSQIIALLYHFTRQDELLEPFAIDDTIMQEMNRGPSLKQWPSTSGQRKMGSSWGCRIQGSPFPGGHAIPN